MPNTDDIVISFTNVENFKPNRCLFYGISYIYIHNNYKRTLFQKVCLKSCLHKRCHLVNHDDNNYLPFQIWYRLTAEKHGSYTIFQYCQYSDCCEAYFEPSTPQFVHRPRWCGIQTLPLKMHYARWWKIGEGMVGFWPITNSVLLFVSELL